MDQSFELSQRPEEIAKYLARWGGWLCYDNHVRTPMKINVHNTVSVDEY